MAKDTANDTAGREASKPTEIPGSGWKAIGKRVVAEIKEDHLSLLAAGVAFKALLALFPTIVAAVTIWSMVASPSQIESRVQSFTSALPEGAAGLIESQVSNVANAGSSALSIALITSLALALLTASGGMAGLMEGTTAAYDEVDERKFPVKRGLAILLMLGAILFLLITFGLIAILPALLDNIGLGSAARTAIAILQWPILAIVMAVALAVVYKYGPDRDDPEMRWASWGAAIATVLWLIGSALFTLYVNNFGSFGETYGTFAGIIILMLWLFLTAFVVLLGAEINAEMERQTAKDTTVGPTEPIGQRGAQPADTTPESFDSPRL